MTDEWIRVKFEEIDKRLDQAFTLRDRALEQSRVELMDRLAKMNEIREQLDSQARTFARQDWISAQLEAVIGRVSRNELSINTLHEKSLETERRNDRKLIIVGVLIAAIQLLLFLLERNGIVP